MAHTKQHTEQARTVGDITVEIVDGQPKIAGPRGYVKSGRIQKVLENLKDNVVFGMALNKNSFGRALALTINQDYASWCGSQELLAKVVS